MNLQFEKLKSISQELREFSLTSGDLFGVDKLDSVFFEPVKQGAFVRLPPSNKWGQAKK